MRDVEMIPEASLVGDHGANGEAENTVTKL